MELALRGMGAMIVNADGTISVTVDPNATVNANPIVTPNPKAINYGAMPSPVSGMTQADYDAIQADLAQLAPGSAIDSPAALAAAADLAARQALALAPVSGCPAGQVASNGICVPATFGIPTTTLVWIGVAIAALFFMRGK